MACMEWGLFRPSRLHVQVCVSFSPELARQFHTAFVPQREIITKRSPAQVSRPDPSLDGERIRRRDQNKPADLSAGAIDRTQALRRPLGILKYIAIAVRPGVEKGLNLLQGVGSYCGGRYEFELHPVGRQERAAPALRSQVYSSWPLFLRQVRSALVISVIVNGLMIAAGVPGGVRGVTAFTSVEEQGIIKARLKLTQ